MSLLAKVAVPAALLLLGPACAPPSVEPSGNQRPVEDWKQQCGLLWILSVGGRDHPRLQITGKSGDLLDYGGGFAFGDRRLASSFCKAEVPATRVFRCVVDLDHPAPAGATLEAWYQGQLLQTWTLPGVRHFEARVPLPQAALDRQGGKAE